MRERSPSSTLRIGLVLVTLIMGLAAAYVGWRYHAVSVEQEVKEHIVSIGGTVTWSSGRTEPQQSFGVAQPPAAFDWWSALTGGETITKVELAQLTLTPDDLRQVARLPHLEELWLEESDFPPSALSELAPLNWHH